MHRGRFSVAYTSTKHAITGLTKSTSLRRPPIRHRLRPDRHRNAVTPMTERMTRRAAAQRHDHRRAAHDVSAVANAIIYMDSLPLDANVQFMTVMATKMPFVGRGVEPAIAYLPTRSVGGAALHQKIVRPDAEDDVLEVVVSGRARQTSKPMRARARRARRRTRTWLASPGWGGDGMEDRRVGQVAHRGAAQHRRRTGIDVGRRRTPGVTKDRLSASRP